MTDDKLLTAFETCALPNTAFRHLDHVRVAWLYVRRHGPAAAESRMLDGLQRFAAAHGVPQLYNDTLTRFWVRLVAHVVEAFPAAAQFDETVACFPRLQDTALPYRHYRQVTLGSEDARRRYVEPDLLPMP